jgi:hypothetical protein
MRRGAGDRGSSFPRKPFLVADATIDLKVTQRSAARRGSGSIVAAGD